MEKQTIRSIRKGSVQWNEEDRLTICQLLVKAGYAVQLTRHVTPESEGKRTPQYEYQVDYWEEEEDETVSG